MATPVFVWFRYEQDKSKRGAAKFQRRPTSALSTLSAAAAAKTETVSAQANVGFIDVKRSGRIGRSLRLATQTVAATSPETEIGYHAVF